MRGEYWQVRNCSARVRELPPRARRIRRATITVFTITGTTSACAENTYNPTPTTTVTRNYLRVRGEYKCNENVNFICAELPPRARRIQHGPQIRIQIVGTTSACAENTANAHNPVVSAGNYLRVRGEYAS